MNAAKASIPNKRVTVRPNEPKWITSYIKRQIRQRKRLFKTAKRVNNETAWTKFKQKRNSVTKQIREAKQRHNEKLANELKDTTYSNSWYKTTSKLLKSNDDTHLIPYLETQNNLAETETEIAQVLNTYFAN
ncbi:MAG: hypothetical protein AB2693_23200 [Candidatus Thiodiazotropha sp.]